MEEERYVSTPENGGSALIPEGELQPGSLYGIAHQPGEGNLGLVRLDLQVMPGNGKFTHTGFGSGSSISDELKEAVNYCRSNLNRISQSAHYADFEMHMKATDYNLEVSNDRMNLSQITEQNSAKRPNERKPNNQKQLSQTTKRN